MQRISRVFSFIAIGALVGALGLPLPAAAQSMMGGAGARTGTWEFTLPLVYSESKTLHGEGGSSVDLNADFGFGFGFGYNFNNHFQLGGMFNWSTRNYDATLVDATTGTTRKASGYLDASTISLNATYFFLASDLTPFVSANVGSTFLDSNIPSGSGSTGCWWDPWWGYICSTYVPTKTETDVSYGAGVGMRWDLSRAFSMQASYNRLWIDAAKSTPDFTGWRLDFIFRM